MPKPDPQARLAEAAFRLLSRKGWSQLTLAETARAARIPLARLNGLVPSKVTLLGAMLRHIGNETAERYRRDGQEQTPRDRLFDVLMTWFEVLTPRKAGLRALYRDLRHEPLALAAARTEFITAAQWLLVLAEADAGTSASIRAVAVVAFLAHAIPVWLEDGKEAEKTMARLDADLRRAALLFQPERGRSGAAKPASARRRATRP